MDEKILNSAKEQFEKFTEKAKNLVNDNEGMKDMLSKVEEKLKDLKLDDTLKDLPVLFSMAKSYVNGQYKEAPITSLIAVVAALLYFINSSDIIPDSIPVLGIVDDAAIIFICLKATSKDIEKYKEWAAANGVTI